jgi:hypothetical protein
VSEQEADTARPVLRIVHGAPSPAELAALVAVVTAMAGDDDDPGAEPPRSAWAAPYRLVRQPMTRGGWRGSFAPR